MRLVKEKAKGLERAKTVTKSDNYIVCSTGSQVKIFDKSLNLLHTVKNVQYVYKCLISPDEQKILLVSAANLFYIVQLDSFHISKHTVRGKYDGNLEGRGCWSFDGKGCCFCVVNDKTLLSALRIYKDIALDEYCELLCDEYWLTSILAVQENNKYLLTGYDRQSDKSFLIWYDGKTFEKFELQCSTPCNMADHAKYIKNDNICIVVGDEKTVFCTIDGKLIKKMELPQQKSRMFSFSNVFDKQKTGHLDLNYTTQICSALGLEDIDIPDQIMDVCYSKCNQYIYVATLKGLLCLNVKTNVIEAKIDYSYGVIGIEEIEKDLLMVTTWDSIDFVRVIY